ncbi:hypothetical protein RC62_2553 [Flavobacterium aquidurense]|uniref:Uncharacterized protein n=1 Tax=Flavobacterium aquidurense TaxID=362413 RepID=A0A0Q0WNL5_9FLAO|nr:hypothetical protein RC62_2553 [Flavobacterium aquidurense]
MFFLSAEIKLKINFVGKYLFYSFKGFISCLIILVIQRGI